MKKRWNDPCLKNAYLILLETAKQDGFTDEELESPYLDKLSHQTKSKRTMRMIRLAYTLGELRGVAKIDEGKTPIALQ
jgi:hypothetical protein